MSILSCILLALSIVSFNTMAGVASLSPPEAILKFTPSFYKQTSEGFGGEIIVSPFTALNALAMFSEATKGNTYKQLTDGLGIKPNKAKVAKQFHDYYEDLKDDAGSAELTIFNEIFVQKRHQLQSTFKKLVTRKFMAGIRKVNFANALPAANTVNTFVMGKTNGIIQDVVRPNGDMFSADTRAVLINGCHFHGNWERPFDEQKSYWGSFNGLPIGFMTTLDTFNYAALPDLRAQAIEMNYANSDLSLVIVLPDYSLTELQDRIEIYEDWSKITANMQPRYVNLNMPKFRSYYQLSLNPMMTNLNMGEMYTSNADLSGFLTDHERLKVFEVHQSTSIQIDEGASEIASGTGILPNSFVLADTPTCEPVIQFNLNRPFVYYLRNRADDTIFFVGHLESPITG